MNEKLQISLKSSKAYAHSLSDIVHTPDGNTIEYRHLYSSQLDAVRQALHVPESSAWWGTAYGKSVNVVHFSDIHGDQVNLRRIVSLMKSAPFTMYGLFTGDMVNYQWSEGIAFWENVDGAEEIMTCIGNHDSFSGGNWYAKTAAECYDRYISPFVSNWGVTYTEDVCYYYKDWADKSVRLIVVDIMHWDSAQESWLVATLASAKTAGYHVIVAGHSSPGNSDTGIRTCPFDTIGANRTKWEGESYGKMNSAVPAAVQDFIDAGGHFVCYLCGHTHSDMFRHLTSYPTQLYIAVANAGTNLHVSQNAAGLLDRVVGQKSEELYNIVSVQPTRSLLTVIRVGADHDTIGRHIGTVVYDYANNQIIWND